MKLRRHSALWPTLILPCAACGGVCGDGVVDPGEACDAAGDLLTLGAVSRGFVPEHSYHDLWVLRC